MDLLVESGANASTADVHGAYPIHYAAQMCGGGNGGSGCSNNGMTNGDASGTDARTGLSVLRRLIFHKAPVDVMDRDGRQPLMWAASSGEQ